MTSFPGPYFQPGQLVVFFWNDWQFPCWDQIEMIEIFIPKFCFLVLQVFNHRAKDQGLSTFIIGQGDNHWHVWSVWYKKWVYKSTKGHEGEATSVRKTTKTFSVVYSLYLLLLLRSSLEISLNSPSHAGQLRVMAIKSACFGVTHFLGLLKQSTSTWVAPSM